MVTTTKDEELAGTKSMTRRIIAGDTLPVAPQQTIAFLRACYVLVPAELRSWLEARIRTLPCNNAWDNGVGQGHGSLVAQVASNSEQDCFDTTFISQWAKNREVAAQLQDAVARRLWRPVDSRGIQFQA
ncbi:MULTISPECIES: hypothetical protein [Streptomyces]|uniref:hypothetical protein n=1 Tax=Streptomyces TaxID=1883 RepID=UPI001319CD2B|nr:MULTISPECIES: hypothetical protein [Streptomyces]MYS91942.1 hypothetical protein [Streptomyces sp. SID5464]